MRRRILIADDNEDVLEVWHNYLCRPPDFECVTARDGREALSEYVRAREGGKPFDLLMLDVMMPHYNGFQVAERVRGYFGDSETPIVIITGMPDYLTEPRGHYLNAEVWSKPIEPAEFRERVARLAGAA